MRKLHLAAGIYARFGGNALVASLRPFFKRDLPVLAYHRIMQVENDYPFDRDLISATPDEFRKQMSYIKKNYNPLRLDELVELLSTNKRIPKKSILVTFDDGFNDNYYIAYPILKEIGVPATIFVTTDFINSVETIWYERLAYFFIKTEADEINIPELGLRLHCGKRIEDRRKNYTVTIEKLKLVSDVSRREILRNIYSKYGDPYGSAPIEIKRLSLPMTWDQLRELHENGISIGSHTVSHPVLTMLEPQQLEFELAESREILENQLQNEVNAIAYPVGQPESYSTEVIEGSKRSGYKLGFTYVDRMNRQTDLNRYSVHRLHVDFNTPHELFMSKISLPEIFCE